MGASAAETDWSQVSGFVANAMGLHFPQERWVDLQRGVTKAAEEFGFNDVATCAGWLLSASLTREQLQVLATHLTIGETYFFREPQTFDLLAQKILPALVHARRQGEKRLRLWSAACCSGEEAYSLAILMHQVIPDWKDWQVTILATDINPRFLRKAAIGSYGEWSFRNAPEGFKERYFNRTADGHYVVMDPFKSMVTFTYLNLAVDHYPSLATDTNAMDFIFCRNVLMYFTPAQVRKVVANLHNSLMEGGWLAVSPSETSQALFSRFATRNFPGVILYQKSSGEVSKPADSQSELTTSPSPKRAPTKVRLTRDASPERASATRKRQLIPEPDECYSAALRQFELGHYAEVTKLLLVSPPPPTRDPRVYSLLARAFANQGQLVDALAWCEPWIAADKLESAGHYLKAIILLEQGDQAGARTSLQKAIYLTPGFILAHFALGNLARGSGKRDEAARHFTNARHLLSRHQPDDTLPESDGLTAVRLTEAIAAITAAELTL